ncbi:MAG: hypothetical protein ACREV7_09555 [Steroidobacteraceae bacterium]
MRIVRPRKALARCALLLGATWLCAQLVSATTRATHAPSVSTSFEAFWSAAQDLSFPQQEPLWERFALDPPFGVSLTAALALLTNLAQILVAPLLLVAEAGFALGLRSEMKAAAERRAGDA